MNDQGEVLNLARESRYFLQMDIKSFQISIVENL